MKYLGIILLILSCCSANSQSVKQKLEAAYTSFENDKQMRFGSSSLTVMNAETGEIVYSKNRDLGLASASTLKTITAATAYHLLGQNYKWETKLGYNGQIINGVLNGDIIITGSGDPTLGSERYEETKSELVLKKWVSSLQSVGIKKVIGSVIVDDRVFGTQTMPGGWTWQDMGNYYGAGPSSLTWRENQFELIFKPGRVGEEAVLLRTEPAVTYLKIINEVKTGAAGTGDNVYAYSAPYSETVYLRGTYAIDLNKKIGASVPDPAFDAGFHLTAALSKAGIDVVKGNTTARKLGVPGTQFQAPVTTLISHSSPSLNKIIYWFNQKSINLYGEHLIKTFALKHGKEPTTQEGVKIMKSYWSKRLSIDEDEMNLYDGSGLSPANRITTSAMSEILCSIQNEPWFQDFYKSLPEYNNMKMKSGSISDVIGYTGYHKNSAGTTFVFSYLINNYNGSSSSVRQKMFKVLDILK